jgi:hypothetical protein
MRAETEAAGYSLADRSERKDQIAREKQEHERDIADEMGHEQACLDAVALAESLKREALLCKSQYARLSRSVAVEGMHRDRAEASLVSQKQHVLARLEAAKARSLRNGLAKQESHQRVQELEDIQKAMVAYFQEQDADRAQHIDFLNRAGDMARAVGARTEARAHDLESYYEDTLANSSVERRRLYEHLGNHIMGHGGTSPSPQDDDDFYAYLGDNYGNRGDHNRVMDVMGLPTN